MSENQLVKIDKLGVGFMALLEQAGFSTENRWGEPLLIQSALTSPSSEERSEGIKRVILVKLPIEVPEHDKELYNNIGLVFTLWPEKTDDEGTYWDPNKLKRTCEIATGLEALGSLL